MPKNIFSESSAELATILGHDGVFEGKITVKHSIRIDGFLQGDVNTTETLTIGKEGVIEGNVSAKNLIAGGRIKGTVLIAEKTVLETTSNLEGSLKTGKLVIEEGAVLQGSTDMTPPSQPKGHGRILEAKSSVSTEEVQQ